MVELDRKTLAILMIIDLVIVVGLVTWVNIEGARMREAMEEARASCDACIAGLPEDVRVMWPENETACPVCNMSRAIDTGPVAGLRP